MMRKLDWQISFGSFLLFLFLCQPGPAEATQGHGGWEGLASHLFAHIIFFSSLIYLGVRLFQGRQALHSGWKWIFSSAIIFAVWNVQTFFVHVYREYLTPHAFTGMKYDLAVSFHAQSFPDLLYYLGRMDHFLLLPALLCLFYGIRFMLHDKGESV
jgi:hypothetical protein